MTTHDKINYLRSYEVLSALISDKQSEYDKLRTLCEKSTTTLSDATKGGMSSREDMYIKLSDMEEAINKLIYERTCLRARIMNSFSLLMDGGMLDVMICTYIFCMTEREIAKQIGKSQFYVRNLRSRALAKLVIDAENQT